MRVVLPKFTSQKLLFEYLRDMERDLIEQKCAMMILSEPIGPGVIGKQIDVASKSVTAELKAAILPDSIIVDAIANLSLWMDSHMDVSAPDSWKKSITERGKKMVWLADHAWTIRNKIAKVMDVYAMDIDLRALGIKSDIKTAQGLIFQGEFNPRYNKDLYDLYDAGMVDQHSIGLQYVQIDLCINDPEDKTHYKNWEKCYPQIINKNKADSHGYFWWVKEQKIFENSAVLFGSNEMTPTISTQTAQSLQTTEPEKSTLFDTQPSNNEAFAKGLEKFYHTLNQKENGSKNTGANP